jgi:soluble lytic murein transglycosylase-like protein
MMYRHLVVMVTTTLMSLTTGAYANESFRFVGADGTVYYTNAPTDPAYRRMGFVSGTAAGFLRLPPSTQSEGVVEHIKQAAERYGVPENLVKAVIRVESAFNPRAVSPKGARGLMQLMPQTASLLGVRDSFDPGENIDGGVRHLRHLLERFGNDVRLALAAYNAGEQAVTNYRGVPPYAETQGYVAKILSIVNGSPDSRAAATAESAEPRTDALSRTYRATDTDGTVIYTNIPPNGRR